MQRRGEATLALFSWQPLSFKSRFMRQKREIIPEPLPSITIPIQAKSRSGVPLSLQLQVKSACPESLRRTYKVLPDERIITFAQLCEEAVSSIFEPVTSSHEGKRLICSIIASHQQRLVLEELIHRRISFSDYGLTNRNFPPMIFVSIHDWSVGPNS